MNARVGAETGFRQCGIIYLLATDAEIAAKTRWYEQNARPYGLTTRLISATEAHTLQPGAAVAWKGALYSPDDGRAEPEIATPPWPKRPGATVPASSPAALCAAWRRKPVAQCCRNREGCHSLRCRGAGWRCVVAAVPRQSRRGPAAAHRCQFGDALLTDRNRPGHSASGGKFCFRRRFGRRIHHRPPPFLGRRHSPRKLPSGAALPAGSDARLESFAFASAVRCRTPETPLVARIPLSPFETIRVLDPEPVDSIIDDALSSLKQCYPAFEAIEIAERWAGCIDATPTSFR